jgi:hypothetical protein
MRGVKAGGDEDVVETLRRKDEWRGRQVYLLKSCIGADFLASSLSAWLGVATDQRA